MSFGAVAAAAGALFALYLSFHAFLSEGPKFYAVALPLFGAIALATAAFSMYRRALSGAQFALAIWLILGILPADIPLWPGMLILLALVSAARASFVLRRLNHVTK